MSPSEPLFIPRTIIIWRIRCPRAWCRRTRSRSSILCICRRRSRCWAIHSITWRGRSMITRSRRIVRLRCWTRIIRRRTAYGTWSWCTSGGCGSGVVAATGRGSRVVTGDTRCGRVVCTGSTGSPPSGCAATRTIVIVGCATATPSRLQCMLVAQKWCGVISNLLIPRMRLLRHKRSRHRKRSCCHHMPCGCRHSCHPTRESCLHR